MAEIANFGEYKVLLLSLNVSIPNLEQCTKLTGKSPYKDCKRENCEFHKKGKCPVFLGKESAAKCVEKFWALRPFKANQADYVIGVCKGYVYTVAKIIKPWKNVELAVPDRYFSDSPELEAELKRCIENGEPYCEPNFPNINLLERYACVAEMVEDSHLLSKQMGKKVPPEHRFYGNVIRFVNI